jgi:hypothetical protein
MTRSAFGDIGPRATFFLRDLGARTVALVPA